MPGDSGQAERIFGSKPHPIEDSVAIIDARGFATLSVLTFGGAGATIQRVDEPDAAAQGESQRNLDPVGADEFASFTVDWPFYRITATGAILVALA